MKLIYSPTSPFARKARILVLEMKLQNQVEFVDLGLVSPVTSNDNINAINPLGFIPALVLDDDDSMYDSTVICEYLNDVGKGKFFPADNKQRYRALKLQALADGLLDTAVALRYEIALRPEQLQWQNWIEQQNLRIKRSISELESQQPLFAENPTIGEVAVTCALSYLDFRFESIKWREDHRLLGEWYEYFQQRDSVQQTCPG